jgi:ligand-binding sensor domain-containing protein/serine phosphatase RsbU (regulator of sigma subunit)
MRNFSLVILFLFILLKTNVGQNRNFIVTSIDEGLPNSNITAIYNDSRGLLWIGTETGLCRYDGNTYKTYSKKDGLPGSWIRAITEDKYGRIWVGTDNGLSIFNGRAYKNYKTISDSLPLIIYMFFNDSKNNIWIGTSGKGAIKAELAADSIKFSLYDKSNGVEAPNIFTICEINKKIVLGSFGYGLYVLTDKKVSNYQHPLLPSNHILSSRVDKTGSVYFSTYNAGIFYIDSRKSDKYWPNNVSTINCNLDETQVWDILLDKDDQLWIATNNKGVGRIKANDAEFCDATTGLPSDFIYKLYQDRENNIWFGTYGKGLVHFIGDHFAHFNKDDGLPGNVLNIKQHPDGYFLVGTNTGLYKLTFRCNKPLFSPFNSLLKNTQIKALEIDKQGRIWVGTNKGVQIFSNNRIEKYTTANGLINNEINDIYIDSQQRAWIGTIGGITIINKNDYFPIDLEAYGFSNNEIQCIVEGNKRAMWVGTNGGLIKFQNDAMTTFVEEDGLLEKQVTSVVVGNSGIVWIGTQGGGLYMLNEKWKKPIHKFADDKVLSSNTIYSLLLFDKNTLIAGTDKGFDRISIKDDSMMVSVANYDRSNGFFGEENQQNAIFKDKQDNVWFGTVKYLTRYSPKLEKHSASQPRIQIDKIKLFFKDYESRDTTKFDNFFGVSDSISFSYNQNHITFQFTGISLRNPEKVLYSYKLEGWDLDWSPPRRMNEAPYSGLKPGAYIFKVRSMGDNGIWNKEPATFRFEIRPPFWQRWWFFAIIIVFGFGLLVLFISWRERNLKLAKLRLETQVKERTAEVVRQKEEIECQRDELGRQHDIVRSQNKDITDSIHYAERIQKAILTSEAQIKDAFTSYFILFKPRNIVSGDFYWFGGTQQYTIVVAADCTGHGVPGAFMSMLGITLLNKIIIEEKIYDSAQILNNLREDVISSLQQNDLNAVNKDGMDITIVVVDKENHKMNFAGANNSMYFLRNGEITQFKGDKMPVAIFVNMREFNSTQIDLQRGDRFYLMSDGYEDQFGGPNGKKFMSKQLVDMFKEFIKVPMQDQQKLFDKRFNDWKQNIEQVDDVLLMGFEILI